MMKNLLIFSVLFCQLSISVMAQNRIEPTLKSKTSFAIIIDSKSYEKTKNAVTAYRDVIEKDGLGTYIIYNDWKSATEIRELLFKLYSDKKSPLEGAVFVGDIPIPLIRDAQHLTSAFKMDQRRPWSKSSVPSDRYYDDFGLKFDFIKQDSIKSLYFYYSLRADSEHRVHSDIYSARIKPLEKGKEDKYIQLEKYLKKVVAERTTNTQNIIDNFTMARGHGYNSESKAAWSGEQLALSQQFPELFKTNSKVKFIDFDSDWPIKPILLNEVQRPELDVLLLHHHGANDTQYLNGYKEGSDVTTSKENIKLYLRSKIRSAVEDGKKDKEEVIKQYMASLDVPRSWCEETFDPKKIEEDSLYNQNLDIHVSDVLKITPNPRFVIFDACFNGSFYEDEYIAGAYIFNSGKTIVAQGNTVNALQDKWPDEFLGLLNSGIRIGLWNKQINYLETHIIGDPTYRFTKNSNINFDINEALTLRLHDVGFWKKQLDEPNADIQAIALRVLYYNNYSGISTLLRNTYFKSDYFVVRLEALKLLSWLDNEDFLAVLPAALNDSYELTRRLAANFVEDNGSDNLIPALVSSFISDPTSNRVKFKVIEAIKYMNLDKVKSELEKQKSNLVLYNYSDIDDVLGKFDSYRASEKQNIETILDHKSKVSQKRLAISQYKNNPTANVIDPLLAFVSDTKQEKQLRILAVETLGWYNYSYRKTEIVEGLKKLIDNNENAFLVNEITKTQNRLK